MNLIIAEKPSVAMAYARILGATKRHDGYLEGNGYVVSWCIGHLVELAEPQAYDERYHRWRTEDLPILPQYWLYTVSPATAKQFRILKGLMQRPEVTEIINCADAGREGEAIVRLVCEMCGCTKPMKRLWISSMEDDAIREGFANLKPSSEYDNLYQSALCRERADWIVGMNATRLFSCLYDTPLAIGRVMTPTLAMVAERDAAIASFRAEPFYTVELTMDGFTAGSRRFADRESAETLLSACRNEPDATVLSAKRKEKSEKAPLLFDLTTLQRTANRLFGFTAQQTLDYAQSLYEKKLLTYPRTDSRYLTEDMASVFVDRVAVAEMKTGLGRSTLDIPWKSHTPSRLYDNSKVSDHYAILPTGSMEDTDWEELPEGERKLMELVCVQLLCAASGDYRYAETEVILSCAREEFTWKGKEILDPGFRGVWQRFYPAKGKNTETADNPRAEGKSQMTADGEIPEPGRSLPITDAGIAEGMTSPPRRFTEDTLLSAMENAGNGQIPEDAERRGLGTPATRAGIIEKLVKKGLIERTASAKSRQLISTEKGRFLAGIVPEQIKSADMTAEWEQKLLQVERGEMDPAVFMSGITDMVRSLVKNCEQMEGEGNRMTDTRKTFGICPHCGAAVVEKDKGWFCSSRGCRFVLWKENAFFTKIGKHLTPQIAEKLMREGRVRLKDCRSRKTGKTYNADLVLTTEDDGRARFSMEFDKSHVKDGRSRK